MIEKHFIELMNREIDGVNSPDESMALQTYLKSSEEGRRRYEELQGVVRMFSAAGDITPPSHLDRTIMASIVEREATHGARTERRSILDVLSPRRKLAYSFAAGLACGLILLFVLLNALSRPNKLDRKDLYGALVEKQERGAAVATEHVLLTAANLSGSVGVQYRSRSLTVILDLEGPGELETTLTPAASLSVESVSAPSCGAFDVRTSPGGVTLRTSGRCGIIVIFRDETGAQPAVNVSIASGGTRLFERTIARDKTRDIRK
jgi:hypothetical protein